MSDNDVLYDDDGRPVGYGVPIEGGGAALVDETGAILYAVDADGSEIDAADLEYDGESFEVGGAWDFEPEPEPDPEPVLNADAQANLTREMDRLRKHLGRDLTRVEKEEILAPRLYAQAQTTGHFDVFEAVKRAESDGTPLLDLDTSAGRQKFYSARMGEQADDERQAMQEQQDASEASEASDETPASEAA